MRWFSSSPISYNVLYTACPQAISTHNADLNREMLYWKATTSLKESRSRSANADLQWLADRAVIDPENRAQVKVIA